MYESNRSGSRSPGDNLNLFNYKWRYVILFFTIATGVATLWEKCGQATRRSATQMAVTPTDSPSHPTNNFHKKETAPVTPKPIPLAAPLERAMADDIEFRLMRAEGSLSW